MSLSHTSAPSNYAFVYLRIALVIITISSSSKRREKENSFVSSYWTDSLGQLVGQSAVSNNKIYKVCFFFLQLSFLIA